MGMHLACRAQQGRWHCCQHTQLHVQQLATRLCYYAHVTVLLQACGALQPGGVITEGTAGSTGVSLAMVGECTNSCNASQASDAHCPPYRSLPHDMEQCWECQPAWQQELCNAAADSLCMVPVICLLATGI